jgi:heme-degrading monooxygenase HmoA
MIARIRHGCTTSPNADRYKALLKKEIFVGIHDRQIYGYRGIQLLYHDLNHEDEFITIMTFDSLDAVRDFASDDYEAAVVLEQHAGIKFAEQ